MMTHDDLEALCLRYDGFLLDLWGVVMDGVSAFPGAVAWLARRRTERKPVWFLSNASRTMAATATLLADLGIARELYAGVTTSGQLAMDALTDPRGAFADGAIHVVGEIPELNGWPDAVTVRFTARLEDATLLVAAGSFPPTELAGRLVPLLDALDKPMICANPDRELVFGGQPLVGAGMLAQRFAEAGGTVHWFGKPEPRVFAQGRTQLRELGARQVLFIGDSMVTDIPGARGAGLDTLLVTSTGIHRTALGVEFNTLPPPARLKDFLGRHDIQPNWVTAGLI
ncbi:MAG TPA: TIGR01459 family HAD-type hydrolase [Candidatus Competibacter sp.]|nr:TIGR01459 family HAD-type hydrolase [Candidatus Competibacteraceae bacterium]HPE71315.1 TIGR01459 family HAD-type hydrolase [Candidatus Competibacter sp.]HRW67088.1 TIGR01459 family HAD-type hydrolase [Candidatus Competibacter sp.]